MAQITKESILTITTSDGELIAVVHNSIGTRERILFTVAKASEDDWIALLSDTKTPTNYVPTENQD